MLISYKNIESFINIQEFPQKEPKIPLSGSDLVKLLIIIIKKSLKRKKKKENLFKESDAESCSYWF